MKSLLRLIAAVIFVSSTLLTFNITSQLPNVRAASCDSYDFNGDGKVDVLDVQRVAFRVGTKVGDSNYDPAYDLDKDGDIDQKDVDIISSCLSTEGPGNPCLFGVCKTAIGDIPANPFNLAQKVITFGIGLAGGIALILMVIGSIRVLTSSGDQQRLSAGRDMIVAALAGLLFLIFSIIILHFLGVNVLGGIPSI